MIITLVVVEVLGFFFFVVCVFLHSACHPPLLTVKLHCDRRQTESDGKEKDQQSEKKNQQMVE